MKTILLLNSFFEQPLDSNQGYTQDHEVWRHTLRKFVEQEILPNIREWEKANTFPVSLYQKAADVGLMAQSHLFEPGSTEKPNYLFDVITAQELAKTASPSLVKTLMSHRLALMLIDAQASDEIEQKVMEPVICGEKVLTLAAEELTPRLNVANMFTCARKEGNCYLVDGSKMYINSGMNADFYIVVVKTMGAVEHSLSLLLLEKAASGFTQAPLKLVGGQCSDTAVLSFNGCRVAEENLIGNEGGAIAAFSQCFSMERVIGASGDIASGQVCLDELVGLIATKGTLGGCAKAEEINLIAASMADKIRQSFQYLYQCVTRISEGKVTTSELMELRRLAKETMNYCIDSSLSALAGTVYIRESLVERLKREMTAESTSGVSQDLWGELLS